MIQIKMLMHQSMSELYGIFIFISPYGSKQQKEKKQKRKKKLN